MVEAEVEYLQVAVSSVVRVKSVEVVPEDNAPDGLPADNTGAVVSDGGGGVGVDVGVPPPPPVLTTAGVSVTTAGVSATTAGVSATTGLVVVVLVALGVRRSLMNLVILAK